MKYITVEELLKALSQVENKAAKVVIVDVNPFYAGHIVKAPDLRLEKSKDGFIHIYVDIVGQNPEGV